MRRAARVDGNHAAIVRGLRGIGATVQTLAPVGGGVPDLLVGWKGRNVLLEVKNSAKVPSARKLTGAQVEWHAAWRGQVATVETIDAALAVLGVTAS